MPDTEATGADGAPVAAPLGKPPQSRSILLRAVFGLILVGVVAGGGAFLMHAGIDPASDALEGAGAPVRNEALEPVRHWRDLTLTRNAEPGIDRDDLVVIDSDPSVLVPRSGPAPRIEALRKRPDGGRRLVLVRLDVALADEQHGYWQRSWVAPAPPDAASPAQPSSVQPLDLDPSQPDSLRAFADTARPAAGTARPWHTPSTAAPLWLLNESVTHPGRWHVRYWDVAWQALLAGSRNSLVASIMAAGADGVVIDRAGGAERTIVDRDRPAPDAMRDLVITIATTARRIKPDAIVMVRNGEEMAADPAVRRAIDGFVREDLLHEGDERDHAETDAATRRSLRLLARARSDGLIVLVSERVTAAPVIERTRKRLAMLGFVPSFPSSGGAPAPGKDDTSSSPDTRKSRYE